MLELFVPPFDLPALHLWGGRAGCSTCSCCSSSSDHSAARAGAASSSSRLKDRTRRQGPGSSQVAPDVHAKTERPALEARVPSMSIQHGANGAGSVLRGHRAMTPAWANAHRGGSRRWTRGAAQRPCHPDRSSPLRPSRASRASRHRAVLRRSAPAARVAGLLARTSRQGRDQGARASRAKLDMRSGASSWRTSKSPPLRSAAREPTPRWVRCERTPASPNEELVGDGLSGHGWAEAPRLARAPPSSSHPFRP